MRSHHALHHGAAWYPELWPESVWQEDLRQMQAHGLTCVRIAEFAWSRLEPQDGVIDLVWLRRAMDLCHAHGLGVVLCTPTATPPLWVLARHPDCLWTDRQGRQPIHGGRQHASYHHQGFRDLGVRITTLMARDLGRHPALIAWQTDNEYGGHQDGDTGPHAAARWRVWLEQRYGSIAALNQAWRTDLWSQHYASFTEVPTARTPLTTGHHNYALEADYRRFISDMVRSFNAEQCAAIRAHSDRPITHNSISCIDDGALARDLDFCSVDVYQPPDRIWDPFLHFDSMRHLGRRRGGFWVMETAPECKMKPHGPWPDGWLANFAFATWVSGGEGFSYWLWRQQPTGVEINHPSVLHACGRPTLGATDVAEVGTVRRQLEPLLRGWSPAPAEVALVRCERNGRMLQDNGISTFGGSYSWWECMSGWRPWPR
jgi:beta-galactosidase